MRVLLVTPWGIECGLASYSRFLLGGLRAIGPEHVYDVFEWNLANRTFVRTAALPLLHGPALLAAFDRCDIVHVQYELVYVSSFSFLPLLRALSLIARVRRQRRPKIVLTLHEDYALGARLGLTRAYQGLCYRCADALIVHTESHRHNLPARLQALTTVVPHGIADLGSIRRDASGGFDVFMPGFLRPDRGHGILIQALAELRRRGEGDLRVGIIGKAVNRRYLARLKQRVEESGLGRSITLVPRFVSDQELVDGVAAAGMVVLPYLRSTDSGVLALALAVGTPVVASDVPGFRAVAGDAVVRFPCGDPVALADTIQRFRRDPDWRDRSRAAAASVRRDRAWTRIAAETIAVYRSVLKGMA